MYGDGDMFIYFMILLYITSAESECLGAPLISW